MKIVLILLGSPRKNGNSAVLAEQVGAGASSGGATVKSIILHDLNIKPCRGCRNCQKEEANGCVINDDMQDMYPLLREADVIVLASPVYWFTFSAQLKLCIDRWYAVGIGERNIFAGKELALLLVYADSDPFISGGVNALRSFQDICRYLNAKMAGMVYGSAREEGEIRNNHEIMEKAFRLGVELATRC